MERFEEIKEMQRNNDLAALANLTEYGLQYHLHRNRDKEYDEEKTKEFITGGITLCELLKQGAEASESSAITLEQLEAIGAFNTLKERGVSAEEIIEKTTKALSVLEQALEGKEIEEDKIVEVQDILHKISEHYLETAYEILTSSRA